MASSSVTEKWPWWWWIPVAGGCVIIVIIIVSVCICCCCRRYYRKKGQSRSRGKEDGGERGLGPESRSQSQSQDLELQNTRSFRRLNSSTAKRYLLNVVSVFSWGSEFNGDDYQTPERPSRTSAQHEYMNPEELNVVPPPRPPKKGLRPPSGQHYLNLTKAPPPLEPKKKSRF